ncbi:MAG: sigma-54 dependent transcriptional regulator [Candidatus Thiodiazotropha sp. (ex Ctena orbiculata)]|nr:sigma-54 dependent transcriptional regulator [Candidatus Thiodiazotropha taylori]MBT2998819.1 sigma-54 dependent transcriptional regulator [Candidatus Thiodiazotropha taylori]MBT3002305.1 sigma-54 dependent transcriptional regulator [Candidatus Thiodiazotropha taylori]MBV2109018.1 sigma-54 dependent transcriptional regulator [Candidatus Thiodiazotropha taylori]MBV2113273.1 sigma-54 dependent transcriptional regulator [Candidatus Thiodiazotropha taylori]
MASVLIVDDEPGIRSFLQKGLRKYFGLVETAEDVVTAEELRQHCHFDLIITDIRLPGQVGGVEWVRELREQGGVTGVIFMTAHADMETAIAALRAGAEDFILKPFRMEQMIAAVERYLERQKMQHENFVLRRQVEQIYDSSGMVGQCQQMKTLCGVIKRVAPMPSTVLIEGESGTGKELAARAIHEMSGRAGSFVPVNCGAMTAELLESELFGHVKGAFTGAHLSRDGLFTYANGGTLFLDEIGEMPLSMQAHLLRSLEERTIRPVGSNREVPVDVRIIAASNRDLEQVVRGGDFREDLYYRLNVLSLRIPALRERKEDIPLLVKHFVETLSAELGITPPQMGEADLVRLLDYDWPGNVRELKNVIERCLLLNKSPSLCMMGSEAVGAQSAPFDPSKTLLLEAIEKQHILKVLDLEGGNKSAAARVLGISRKTLERKTQAWGVN